MIKIRRAVVHVDGKFIVKPPKSEAGVRDLVIPPHLLPMVREHIRHQRPAAEKGYAPVASQPVLGSWPSTMPGMSAGMLIMAADGNK
jgi:hypothetical protein